MGNVFVSGLYPGLVFDHFLGHKTGERCFQWYCSAGDHLLAELGECSQQDPPQEKQY